MELIDPKSQSEAAICMVVLKPTLFNKIECVVALTKPFCDALERLEIKLAHN